MRRALPILLLLGGCGAAASGSDAPGGPRVVSINPCVDAVLMHVADPAQIAGISHYSQDPDATSIDLALARRFKATSGTAEEVVALRPDLVIAGAHVAPATIAALKRMHIKLIQLPVPDSIAESTEQVRTIASAMGHADRGEALVGAIDRAVTRAQVAGAAPVPALIWQSGGLVPGAKTLPDELLRVSGFSNLSAAYGLKRWDVLPLEYLVARPPRVLLSVGDAGQGDRMLSHPVLKRLHANIAVRAYPERLMHCGGPTIIDATARLAAIRSSL
ncbi:ABC transporter substrate-binding protein [Sphingomonas sp. CJ20]